MQQALLGAGGLNAPERTNLSERMAGNRQQQASARPQRLLAKKRRLQLRGGRHCSTDHPLPSLTPPPPTSHPAAPSPGPALTFSVAARTLLFSPPPPASASRPSCCACSPCARRYRCGPAGTRRARVRAPDRGGRRGPCWSGNGTGTRGAGCVCSPVTWSASAPALSPENGTASGSDSSCCALSSWCAWSGTSSGCGTDPSRPRGKAAPETARLLPPLLLAVPEGEARRPHTHQHRPALRRVLTLSTASRDEENEQAPRTAAGPDADKMAALTER